MERLEDGIYNIVFNSKNNGQYALDFIKEDGVTICTLSDNNSQKWHVTYDSEKHRYAIWNAQEDGRYLSTADPESEDPESEDSIREGAGSEEPKNEEAQSEEPGSGEPESEELQSEQKPEQNMQELVLKDCRRSADWDINPRIGGGYEITISGTNLAINVDVDVSADDITPNGVSLRGSRRDAPSYTSWVFQKLESICVENVDINESLQKCNGSIIVCCSAIPPKPRSRRGEEEGKSSQDSGSARVLMLSEPSSRVNYCLCLGEHDPVSPDKVIVGVSTYNKEEAQLWYIEYDQWRDCYTIQATCEDGLYLGWTDLNPGGKLSVSTTRTYWQIFQDESGILQIRVPTSTYSPVLDQTLSGPSFHRVSLQRLDGMKEGLKLELK